MGIFVVFLFKSASILALFFLLNKLLLDKETFHGLNRVIWLLMMPLASVLCFIDINLMSNPTGQDVLLSANNILEPKGENSETTVFSGTAIKILFLIWLLGSVFFLIKLTINYVRFTKLIHSSKYFHSELLEECKKKVGYNGKASIIIVDTPLVPSSWMRYILISEKDLAENGREILVHELAHIRLGHSWDLIWADLIIVFQWFNPTSWLIKRSLQQVHEFQVDQQVLKSGISAKQYQLLLIEKAVGKSLYTMANSFNHSKLKNRITMMLKEKSNKWAYAKCLYALPLALLATSVFALPPVDSAMDGITRAKFTNLQDKGKTISEKQIETQDNPPLYIVDGKEVANLDDINPGSIEMVNVLKGQQATEKYGRKGRDGVVEVTLKKGEFEVENEGEKIEVRVIGYGNPENSVPSGQDTVKVQLIGSIVDAQTGEEIDSDTPGEDQPLFIVDGVEVETISDIPTERIESVAVFKDATTIEQYGEKGGNGVIVVTNKK